MPELKQGRTRYDKGRYLVPGHCRIAALGNQRLGKLQQPAVRTFLNRVKGAC